MPEEHDMQGRRQRSFVVIGAHVLIFDFRSQSIEEGTPRPRR
jgi:hypothetical protein